MKKTLSFLKKDILLFTIGLALVCYPIVSGFIQSREQNDLISTYESTADNLSNDERTRMYEDAVRWNEALYHQQKGIAMDTDLVYEEVLDIGNGVMGSIEIPQIDVNLPIYHGTDDSVLNTGSGHLEDSSVPVGGINTHTVLTGHSGLPESKLFTRIDELEKGDLFYIHVLNETMAYEIDTIQTVLPEQADYSIQDSKDLATLVTCTPYGINTHRLMITGHRVPYDQKDKAETEKKIPSVREGIFYILPVIFIVTGIIIFRKRKESK